MNINNNDGYFVWDEFYNDIDWLGESHVQDYTFEGMTESECLGALPESAYLANREYLPTAEIEDVIHDLAEKPYGGDAELFWEREIEDFWHLCEDDFDYQPNGLFELQSAIDVFVARNRTIWAILDRFSWFDPVQHSWGKAALQKALEQFALSNQHFWLYTQSKNTIPLDADFWRPYLEDAGVTCNGHQQNGSTNPGLRREAYAIPDRESRSCSTGG